MAVSIAIVQRLPVLPVHALDRQELEVGVEVELLLPAVGVERLAEIALGVEQADADQRNAQVAGAFQVVAGQHTQAARVDRQALVQPELGREVGHRPRPQNRGVDRPPGIGVLEVLGQPAEGVVDSRVQCHLGRPPLELLGRQPLEELDRVVVDLPPEGGVQLAEERDDIGLPDPPEIAGQFTKLVDQWTLTDHDLPLRSSSRFQDTIGVSPGTHHGEGGGEAFRRATGLPLRTLVSLNRSGKPKTMPASNPMVQGQELPNAPFYNSLRGWVRCGSQPPYDQVRKKVSALRRGGGNPPNCPEKAVGFTHPTTPHPDKGTT